MNTTTTRDLWYDGQHFNHSIVAVKNFRWALHCRCRWAGAPSPPLLQAQIEDEDAGREQKEAVCDEEDWVDNGASSARHTGHLIRKFGGKVVLMNGVLSVIYWHLRKKRTCYLHLKHSDVLYLENAFRWALVNKSKKYRSVRCHSTSRRNCHVKIWTLAWSTVLKSYNKPKCVWQKESNWFT